MIMVARGTLPINTADELVQELHRHPGSLSMASAGVGTQLHLTGEMIESSAHIEMPHVPYKSGTQIATDLIGGHIDLAMMAIPTVLPFLHSGKLKARRHRYAAFAGRARCSDPSTRAGRSRTPT